VIPVLVVLVGLGAVLFVAATVLAAVLFGAVLSLLACVVSAGWRRLRRKSVHSRPEAVVGGSVGGRR
jgi:hypothetical protein